MLFVCFHQCQCNLHLGIHVFAAGDVSYDCCIRISSFYVVASVYLSKAYYCCQQC